MTTPGIDPVSVVAAATALLLGGQLAEQIGSYAVILAAGTWGAAYALSRWHACTRLGAIGYMAAIVSMSLIFTTLAAELIAARFGVAPKLLLGPVAAGIAAVGHDWPKVISIGWEKFGPGWLASKFKGQDKP